MTMQEQLDSQLIAALRERAHRVTPQRLLIHRVLREEDRHATAEKLLTAVSERLPSTSLPTVYATLGLLEELGLARRVAAASGPALFDGRLEEHHHLLCRVCGAVEDVDTSVDAAAALAIARREGMRPERAELVLRGLCARCAKSG